MASFMERKLANISYLNKRKLTLQIYSFANYTSEFKKNKQRKSPLRMKQYYSSCHLKSYQMEGGIRNQLQQSLKS